MALFFRSKLLIAMASVFFAVCGQYAYAERLEISRLLGEEEHPKILASYGGEIDNKKLTEYTDSIGRKLVAFTSEKDDPWTFTVLDSPVVNAFALPGGYVYITRGLLAITNNEAELAGVLGHEIGHIVSGHGEDRNSRKDQAGLGVVLGTLLGGLLGGSEGAADAIELAEKIAEGYVAHHSKRQELEADEIGIELLAKSGYSPFAQADFLDQLAAKEALERKVSGHQYNPNRVDFFASHPATGQRVRKAIKLAKEKGLELANGVLREEAFLREIDGTVYGDTAKEGYVRGLTFSHPEMKLTVSVPSGFILENSSQRVVARNKKGARIVFDGDAVWDGEMDAYIRDRWLPAIQNKIPASNFRQLRSLTIGGFRAATAMVNLETDDGFRVTQLTAIAFSDMTVRFAALTAKSDRESRSALNTSAQTFRALTEGEVDLLSPYRIKIKTVSKDDTVPKLSLSMPLTEFREAQFRAMNGYESNKDMKIGDMIKVVE